MTTTQKTDSGSSRAHSPKPLDFLNIDAQLSDEEGGALTGIQGLPLEGSRTKIEAEDDDEETPRDLAEPP